MTNGDESFTGTHSLLPAAVLPLEDRALCPHRPPPCLHQRRHQKLVGFFDMAMLALARRAVVARAHPCPLASFASRGELIHVPPNLGQQARRIMLSLKSRNRAQ